MSRLAGALVLAALVVLAGSGEASAHGGGADDATNYLTTVLDPGVDGLEWRVHGGDAMLELRNGTGREVVVAGYQQEPYLWFRADGVFENRRSPATSLNRSRDGRAAVPPDADAAAAPEWRRVAGGDSYAWHDHRAHWMAPTPPPAVAADPDVRHVVSEWRIPLEVGSEGDRTAVTASGRLEWIPGVPVWPPMVGVTAIFLLVLAAAAVVTSPSDGRWPGVARVVTVLVWLVAAANVVRLVDDLLAVRASGGQQAFDIIVTVLALAPVVGLTLVARRGTGGGLLAAGCAGLLLMLFFGAESTAQLSASQIATNLPLWVRRWTVAASWMIVVPVFVAAGLGAVMHARHIARPQGDVASA